MPMYVPHVQLADWTIDPNTSKSSAQYLGLVESVTEVIRDNRGVGSVTLAETIMKKLVFKHGLAPRGAAMDWADSEELPSKMFYSLVIEVRWMIRSAARDIKAGDYGVSRLILNRAAHDWGFVPKAVEPV